MIGADLAGVQLPTNPPLAKSLREKVCESAPWSLLTGERKPNPGSDPAQETIMTTTSHTAMTLSRRIGVRILTGTAITAAGFLTLSALAQAHPMLPLAPGACNQYAFNGNFSLKQSNGDTVVFSSIGPTASGNATATGGRNGPLHGTVTGGIQGDKLDFTINWGGTSSGAYTGFVSADGFVHGDTQEQAREFGDVFGNLPPDPPVAHWDSTVPLVCSTPAAPPAAPAAPPVPVSHQPVPPAPAALARLGVAVTGPTTLQTGLSGTYTVTVANNGDVDAPGDLYISYGGKLEQTGQIAPSGSFQCDVINNAGGTTAVHCTVANIPPHTSPTIQVQGRGMTPGPGHLTATVNSDPGVQFGQKSQGLNVTIT